VTDQVKTAGDRGGWIGIGASSCKGFASMMGEGNACGAVLNWVADTEGPVEERI
jgi:hypothetical protein